MNPNDYVLVIDDDLQIRRVLEVLLGRAGVRVVCVTGGEDGLRQIEAEPPKVVITDMTMPGLSGRELCTAISDLNDPPRYRTIVLSGVADASGCAWVDELTETVFVRKPFSPIELLKQVKQCFETGAAVIPSAI